MGGDGRMSFYVKEDGTIRITKDTPFPLSCPLCPAFIPFVKDAKVISCWNCGLKGAFDLFYEPGEYDFVPRRIQ